VASWDLETIAPGGPGWVGIGTTDDERRSRRPGLVVHGRPAVAVGPGPGELADPGVGVNRERVAVDPLQLAVGTAEPQHRPVATLGLVEADDRGPVVAAGHGGDHEVPVRRTRVELDGLPVEAVGRAPDHGAAGARHVRTGVPWMGGFNQSQTILYDGE
jgi:hypothetical protein